MTTIIAFRDNKNKRVLMASDRRVIDGCSKHSLLEPKIYVYDRNPDFVIGCAGAVQLKQILESELYLPTKEDIEKYKITMDIKYLTSHIVPSIRALLKEHNEDGEDGNRIILAYKDKMWTITGGYSIGSFDCDYMAIGSGDNHAIGALKAINKINPEMDITNQLLMTMEIVSECDIATDNDIDIAITGENEIITDNHDYKTYESNIKYELYNGLSKAYDIQSMHNLARNNGGLAYFVNSQEYSQEDNIYVMDADGRLYEINFDLETIKIILDIDNITRFYSISPTKKYKKLIDKYLESVE